jgi:hypothetical protein
MHVIREDREREQITVDGVVIPGWIEDVVCMSCGERLLYHEELDSQFCAQCNAWVSGKCSEPECIYCANRPERPLGG